MPPYFLSPLAAVRQPRSLSWNRQSLPWEGRHGWPSVDPREAESAIHPDRRRDTSEAERGEGALGTLGVLSRGRVSVSSSVLVAFLALQKIACRSLAWGALLCCSPPATPASMGHLACSSTKCSNRSWLGNSRAMRRCRFGAPSWLPTQRVCFPVSWEQLAFGPSRRGRGFLCEPFAGRLAA